jgi:DnaJ family protein C protein 9
MSHIPHSTSSDEPRFIDLINTAIKEGILEPEPEWEKSSKDQKAKKERAKKAKKEEKEAEAAARELGVWDEFYGSGKKTEKQASTATSKDTSGKRGTKRKSAANSTNDQDNGEEDDVSGLASLIAKRQSSRASAFDALLAKYGGGDAEDDEVLEFNGKTKPGKVSKTKATSSGKKGKKGSKNDQDMQNGMSEDGMPVSNSYRF